jgi:hypothetical protein
MITAITGAIGIKMRIAAPVPIFVLGSSDLISI